jgi:hypothetical protein|tara:strand:- start:136 stop:420 length:285 start_codon:yes stop_codon:yes gene_type:complete
MIKHTARSLEVVNQGWQPIETAPMKRNGPHIIATDGRSVGICYWHVGGPLHRHRGTGWMGCAEVVWKTGGDDETETLNPTHWMPLPEPPKEPSR